MSAEVPLYRALSKLGYTSRTSAIDMIKAGEISIDGSPCLDPDRTVSLHKNRLLHNNKLIQKEDLKVILLYKPKSIITSRKDEQNRKTVYSLLPPEHQNLHCVGRLDFATSGLLLLTNNTQLSAWMTDPKNGIARVYLVTVRGLVTPEKTEKMLSGVIENGQVLKPESISIRKSSNRETHLVITLTEGKNREVRRLCRNIGNEVTKLKRVSYGPFTLENLSPGEFRYVNREEICMAFPGAKLAKFL